jgi:hypothetical protein
MAEKSNNNFWGGFLFGAIVGGTVSAIVVARLSKNEGNPEHSPDQSLGSTLDGSDHNQPNSTSPTSQSAELLESDRVRWNLEQKIAQLNEAIDAVSQELSVARANSAHASEPSSMPNPNLTNNPTNPLKDGLKS